MCDELRESLSFLPPRSEPWLWISKPCESSVKKFISRRCAPARALSIEGPAKNELRQTIVLSRHVPEPMIDERRLPNAGPRNDGNDIYTRVCPCCIQESNILLSTKQIASCHR